MKTPYKALPMVSFLAWLLLDGCAAPRAVLWDGTSVEAGEVEGHLGAVGCLSSATLRALGASGLDAAKGVANGRDSLADSTLYRHAVRAMVAGALDMPGGTYVASVHIGLGHGFEIGYRREGDANAWAVRCQFLSAKDGGWNGGAAVQYSSQDYDLPSPLGDLQQFLGYKFQRQDISVPLVFSKPFGGNGKFGSLGLGVVGGWTKVESGFDQQGLYRIWGGKVDALERLPSQSSSFFSYGGIFLLRGGYKYVWVKAGLTVIGQNYGSFQVPATAPIDLSGVSFLPSVGLEFRI